MLQNVKTKVVSATRDLEKQWEGWFSKVASGQVRMDPATGIIDHDVPSALRKPVSHMKTWIAMMEIYKGNQHIFDPTPCMQ
jgi:hypothetical protein